MADVNPSEELRSLLLRFYAAWEASDFEAMGEMLSAGAHFLVIGTDPHEWWTGSEVRDIWFVQAREMGKIAIRSGGPVAYSCSNVGWVADQPILTLPNGRELTLRLSAVAAIERGHWRFVQWHTSLGKTNEEAL